MTDEAKSSDPKTTRVPTCFHVAKGDPAADTGTLRGDLLSAVCTLWRAFRGPLGHALAGLVADMAQDAALASSIRQRVLVPRRRSMREAIERACVRGEVRNDVDVELRDIDSFCITRLASGRLACRYVAA
jgi:Tetracyclin repressor-like, C-terminal domain